jgi:hypothetical protein
MGLGWGWVGQGRVGHCGAGEEPTPRTPPAPSSPSLPPALPLQVAPVVEESEGGVAVYCMEPSLHNFANLVLTRDKFFSKNKADVQW